MHNSLYSGPESDAGSLHGSCIKSMTISTSNLRLCSAVSRPRLTDSRTPRFTSVCPRHNIDRDPAKAADLLPAEDTVSKPLIRAKMPDQPVSPIPTLPDLLSSKFNPSARQVKRTRRPTRPEKPILSRPCSQAYQIKQPLGVKNSCLPSSPSSCQAIVNTLNTTNAVSLYSNLVDDKFPFLAQTSMSKAESKRADVVPCIVIPSSEVDCSVLQVDSLSHKAISLSSSSPSSSSSVSSFTTTTSFRGLNASQNTQPSASFLGNHQSLENEAVDSSYFPATKNPTQSLIEPSSGSSSPLSIFPSAPAYANPWIIGTSDSPNVTTTSASSSSSSLPSLNLSCETKPSLQQPSITAHSQYSGLENHTNPHSRSSRPDKAGELGAIERGIAITADGISHCLGKHFVEAKRAVESIRCASEIDNPDNAMIEENSLNTRIFNKQLQESNQQENKMENKHRGITILELLREERLKEETCLKDFDHHVCGS
ncbi:unnamed protein product [Protopolystoma xenopodis]|uniref:Uncharacterized protein n=1 Tax=Protopolystoma xenopodis TaxID=117903 RepID=A0A448XE16_9PLAT|nr:unnamed protein product [Protopolystoma xenopodis]